MKKPLLFDLVDRAPFAGKFLVKDTYINFVTTPDAEKTSKAVVAGGVLALLGVAHAQQASTGYSSLQAHMERAAAGDQLSAAFFAVDALYTAAMASVAVRQAALLGKVGKKYHTWLKEKDLLPEATRRKEKRPYTHKVSQIIGAVAFTAAGQAAEYASIMHASGRL